MRFLLPKHLTLAGLLGTLTAVLLAGLGLVAPVSTATATGGSSYPTSPLGDPPGANDWDCVPSADRPTPAVLVHGTFGDRRSLLDGLSSDLKADGYCVFSLDYGDRGTQDIRLSARELGAHVDRVLTATGASRVSLVGHSQGGMMPRYYIKYLGGDAVVDDLVGMAPSNHGTTLVGAFASLIGHRCTSCEQQAAGSAFLADLNAGDETPGPVSYTQITTRYDEVVVPHTSGYLTPGPRSTNLTLQDSCPWNLADHLLIPTTTATRSIVLHALGTDGPARADFQPDC